MSNYYIIVGLSFGKNKKMIISERPNNPAYFDKMSDLLNHLLQEQKDGKIQYKELIKNSSKN